VERGVTRVESGAWGELVDHLPRAAVDGQRKTGGIFDQNGGIFDHPEYFTNKTPRHKKTQPFR
jgi:hypothetical protein